MYVTVNVNCVMMSHWKNYVQLEQQCQWIRASSSSSDHRMWIWFWGVLA